MQNVLCRNAGLFQEFKRLESDDETGIIALESPLDTAICVLNYRLSLTTDNVTCTIYTYRVSLLKEKIAKIHKKLVASVSSPLSVSSNKYTSLVVEDVDTQCTTDCVDTTASFVSPSTFSSATVPSMGEATQGQRTQEPTTQVTLKRRGENRTQAMSKNPKRAQIG